MTLVIGALALVLVTVICDASNVSLVTALAVCTLVAALVSLRAALLAAAYVGVLAFTLFNAFIQDREGVLDFHGRDDLLRLALLVLVPMLVAQVTVAADRLHRWPSPQRRDDCAQPKDERR